MATVSSILAWKIPWTEKSGPSWAIVPAVQRINTTEHIHMYKDKVHKN